MTVDVDQGTLTCSVCGKEFETMEQLTGHSGIHYRQPRGSRLQSVTLEDLLAEVHRRLPDAKIAITFGGDA